MLLKPQWNIKYNFKTSPPSPSTLTLFNTDEMREETCEQIGNIADQEETSFIHNVNMMMMMMVEKQENQFSISSRRWLMGQ